MAVDHVKAREEYRKQVLIAGLKILHFLLTVSLFAFFWLLFRYGRLIQGNNFRYTYFVIAGYGIILFFFHRTYNTYLLGYNRISEEMKVTLTLSSASFSTSFWISSFVPTSMPRVGSSRIR